jgi:tRNA (guanine37-N1)-methyltransferase
MRFDIITIFPDFFAGPLAHGILGRAIESGLVQVKAHNLRDFTDDRHQTVDDRPFGGGEGMVLKAEPLFRAVESLGIAPKASRDRTREQVILLSAQGRRFSQRWARSLTGVERITLLCGRYEGVDERVSELLADEELSIGDYVLSGGELAAAVVVDTLTRLVPGALGNAESSRNESFSAADDNPDGQGMGILDCPQYTRPFTFRGHAAPAVLQSGNHRQIREWRRAQALAKTRRNRPDLLTQVNLSDEDQAILQSLKDSTSGGR